MSRQSEFGSPGKNDGAAALERSTEYATKRAQEMFEGLKERYGRQPGTVPVSNSDRKFDYDNRGPDYWPKMALQAVADLKPGEGMVNVIEKLAEHDREMRQGES